MANKKPVKSEEGTTTVGGGSTSTHTATGYILGFSDTQLDKSLPVFDEKGQKILTKVSLSEMGNKERQARKGKERVVYDKFGRESTKQAVKENLANSEKAPQHTLGNVLGLMSSSTPKPRGP